MSGIARIHVTTRFERAHKKLSLETRRKTERREKVFRDNPFDSRLDTHKLHGKDKEVWSFAIDYSYRVKFIFLSEEEVLFLDVGTHDIYK